MQMFDLSMDLLKCFDKYSKELSGPINLVDFLSFLQKKNKRKVQGVPQSQTAALPRPQEEEETDKSK